MKKNILNRAIQSLIKNSPSGGGTCEVIESVDLNQSARAHIIFHDDEIVPSVHVVVCDSDDWDIYTSCILEDPNDKEEPFEFNGSVLFDSADEITVLPMALLCALNEKKCKMADLPSFMGEDLYKDLSNSKWFANCDYYVTTAFLAEIDGSFADFVRRLTCRAPST